MQHDKLSSLNRAVGMVAISSMKSMILSRRSSPRIMCRTCRHIQTCSMWATAEQHFAAMAADAMLVEAQAAA